VLKMRWRSSRGRVSSAVEECGVRWMRAVGERFGVVVEVSRICSSRDMAVSRCVGDSLLDVDVDVTVDDDVATLFDAF